MPDKANFKRVAALSLYGLGMVWSPIFGTSEASVFPSLATFPDALLASRIVNLLVLCAFMAALAVAGDGMRAALAQKRCIIATAIVGALGIAVGALVGMDVLPLWCLYPGAALRGLFWGVTTVLWIDVFVHLQEGSIGAVISAALALYALAGFAVLGASLAHPALAAVLLTVCPPLCCLGCFKVRKTAETVRPVDQEGSVTPQRTRILLYVANLLFGIMLGALLYYFALFDTPISLAAFLVTALVMLVVFSLPGKGIGPHKALRMFMMGLALIVPAVVLTGSVVREVADALASGVLAIIVLYTIIIFADTQARLRKPYWRIPGITQVFATTGMVIACLAFHFVFPEGDVPNLYLVLLAMACMLFVASLFLPNARMETRPWGFSSLTPEESREVKVLRRCGELADSHNLTSRELEILQQLASGSTRDEIAATLFISPATAKTHIRNIYSKLDVHSKQELQQLIG